MLTDTDTDFILEQIYAMVPDNYNCVITKDGEHIADRSFVAFVCTVIVHTTLYPAT